MEIKEIGVVYRRTFQTRPYESLTEEVSLSAVLEFGDTAESCIKQLQDTAQKTVKAHVLPTLIAEKRIVLDSPENTPALNSTPTSS